MELSLYIAAECRRQGVGAKLMEFILARARAEESIHSVVSIITGNNAASLHLHKKYGFRHMGTLYEAGYKFGRLLDVEYYQLIV